MPLTGISPLGLGELGVLLASLIPLLLSPWVLAGQRPTRRQGWALGMMAFVLLGITQSRAACLSAAVGVLVLFGFRWSPRTRLRVFLGLGLCAAVAALLLWRSESARAMAVYAMSGRDLVWTAALRAISEHPLVGVGPAGWESWFGRHFLSVDFLMRDLQGNTFFLSPAQLGGEAHNLLLTKAAEMGLPSAAGLAVFLWAWFRGAWRCVRGLPPGFGRLMAMGSMAAMAGLTAHGFLENGPIIGRARGAEVTIVWLVAALPFAVPREAS
jgi:O-antigen ligase